LAGIMSAEHYHDGGVPAAAADQAPSGQQASGPAEIIQLDLPLHHRHASTVRVVAASLAADIGFSVDEIEDLRLGVDEAVSVMADADGDSHARLHLRFELSGHTITIAVTRSGVTAAIDRSDIDQLAVRILTAVVDRFDVDDGAFVVSKRAAGVHVD